MIAFAHVNEDFNARFSCIYREYKYFFFKDKMDIQKIKEAASKFLGAHDFRNFCKRERFIYAKDENKK